jgi:DNA-binding NarL/FixJ family response regulator
MKILVVDDHPIVRSGIRRLLAAEGQCEMREAASGREALTQFRDFRPDIVVLDLGMPGLGGIEVIGRLKLEDGAVQILVLSMHRDVIYARRALQAGALGFVTKSASPDRLLEAIKQVAIGRPYIEREIAQDLALASIQANDAPFQALSPREFEILRLLADGSSVRQIAEAIGISYKTAANTCSQIKAKLGAQHTTDLVRIAIQGGLVVNPAKRRP